MTIPAPGPFQRPGLPPGGGNPGLFNSRPGRAVHGGRLAEGGQQAERIYASQDNWSIHKHPDVQEALTQWPQVESVWLPTYAPWLNPIEKLWRWLKQGLLKLHRWAEDWRAVRDRVRQFLDQFARGSERLLEYVGLLGNGLLVRMIHGP